MLTSVIEDKEKAPSMQKAGAAAIWPEKEVDDTELRAAEAGEQSTTYLTTSENRLFEQAAHESESQASGELTDQQILLTRALAGDKEAFGEIVHEYSTLMLRTACMIVGDRDVAEDAVQDALIQAWQHLHSLREANALRPWLMRIVVNQCISFKRRVARSTAYIRQTISEQTTNVMAQVADEHKGRMERDWDLAQAIENLPMKQRVVIVLHYYNGMTLPEMARALDTSENTLKKRIQAALSNLRRVLRMAEEAEGYEGQLRAGTLAISAA